jgi:hypothetical protein
MLTELHPVPSSPDYAVTRDGRVFRVTKARAGPNFTRPVPYEINVWTNADGKPYVALSRRTISLRKLLKEVFPEGK